MAVDWLKIRNDYINGGGSYRKLAEKYGVSFSTLQTRAKRESWKEEKTIQCDKVAAELRQKTAERIVDSESEIVAIQSRTRLNIMRQIETRLNLDETDGMEFRRLVQSFIDMTNVTGKSGTADQMEAHKALMDAIRGLDDED